MCGHMAGPGMEAGGRTTGSTLEVLIDFIIVERRGRGSIFMLDISIITPARFQHKGGCISKKTPISIIIYLILNIVMVT